MRKRRLRRCLAVSTVIGNMLMILITLSLAAILVAWAGTTYGSFTGGSQLFFLQRGQALQERFVVEEVFFNATTPSPPYTIMIFVRNVGAIDMQIVAIYANGNPLPFSSSAGVWLCQRSQVPPGTCALPFTLGVQQIVEFNLQATQWTTGTTFTIVVASARGNQAVTTVRAP